VPTTVTLTVPERFTGRNLHYGYHETHVDELMSIYRRTADPVLLQFAQEWRPLAPSKEHLFASLQTFDHEALAQSGDRDAALATEIDVLDAQRLAGDPLGGLQAPDIGVPTPVSPTSVAFPAN
jgi:hypothetical protein